MKKLFRRALFCLALTLPVALQQVQATTCANHYMPEKKNDVEKPAGMELNIIPAFIEKDKGRPEKKNMRINKTIAKFSVQTNPIEHGKLVVIISQPTALLLFDANGKLVWKKKLKPSTLRVNVSNYARGMYFLTSGETAERIKIQ